MCLTVKQFHIVLITPITDKSCPSNYAHENWQYLKHLLASHDSTKMPLALTSHEVRFRDEAMNPVTKSLLFTEFKQGSITKKTDVIP